MGGAAEEAHEAGRLIEEPAKVLTLRLEAPVRLLDLLRALEDPCLLRRLPKLLQLGDVLGVLEDVRDLPKGIQDGRVRGAPEPLFDDDTGSGVAGDAVGGDRQVGVVRRDEAQLAIEHHVCVGRAGEERLEVDRGRHGGSADMLS